MKKLSFVMLLILAVSLSFYSCKRKEEMKPNQVTTDGGVMRVEAVICAYTIKATESVVDGSKLNLPAGSVVCIEAGTRGPLYLKNFVGAPGNPIIFINSAGGQVIFKSSNSGAWAIKVGYCKNIHFTGTGSSNQYGIVVDGGNNGFVFPELTTDWEVDHVEIKNTGFAGMMGKTDPSCDSKTWRDNFTMRNVSIHDNYVHDTGGEGFYIGNSFYNGMSQSCGTVYPHIIEGLRIYKNIVKNSGCEGIQVGCASKDCEIYNNSIESPGQNPFAAYQNNGLQIGAGTGGKCYNNIIKNAPANGLIMNGIGGNLVYNNVIINSGELGIFCDERTQPLEGFSFINNTIVNCGTDGIKLYSEQVPYNNVINNIIINPKSGKYINMSSGVKLTNQNNYCNMSVATAKFVDVNNFALQTGSPAINTGYNVSSFSITKDFNDSPRPFDNLYDIGAYEYGAAVTGPIDTTITKAQAVVSFTLVNADTEKDIAVLSNGYAIDFAKIGTKNLSIRANTNPSSVGSIVFDLDGNIKYSVANAAPYSLVGYSNGNYSSWSPALGAHSITASPYTAGSAAGTKGTSYSVSFTVRNSVVSTAQSVTSFTLVNADTEKDIAVLTSGYIIDFTKIGTKNLNIRANTNPGTVGSVAFGLDANSKFRVENGAPYTLAGDAGGNYNAWTPSLGSHTITATPYSSGTSGGTKGAPLSINISVQNGSVAADPGTGSGTGTGPSIASFTLVNANTDKDIATITNGSVINLAVIGTSKINIRANTNPTVVGSVLFGLDANNRYRIENGFPYSLNGDSGGNYVAWNPQLGTHTVIATPYSSSFLKGTQGTPVKITFNVINSLVVQ